MAEKRAVQRGIGSFSTVAMGHVTGAECRVKAPFIHTALIPLLFYNEAR